jgi:hypothetical protein
MGTPPIIPDPHHIYHAAIRNGGVERPDYWSSQPSRHLAG